MNRLGYIITVNRDGGVTIHYLGDDECPISTPNEHSRYFGIYEGDNNMESRIQSWVKKQVFLDLTYTDIQYTIKSLLVGEISNI